MPAMAVRSTSASITSFPCVRRRSNIGSMPKTLFYIGIVCCVFLAVAAGGILAQEMQGSPVSFIAMHGRTLITGTSAAWAIVVALLAAVAVASILVRMAALLAARNLFGAFLALFAASAAPLPSTTPASIVFFAVVAMLFFSIAVHCVRHRHIFIEMTNLRELLEPRVDPARTAKAVGRVAFDS